MARMTTAYEDAQTASGMVTAFTAESSKIRLVPEVSVSQIEKALTVVKEKQAEHDSADSLLLTLNSLYVSPVPKGITPQMLQEARDKVIQLGMELKTLNMFVDDMNNQKILSPSPISSKEINFDTIRKYIDEYRETQVLITDMEHLADSLTAGEFRLEKLMSDYEAIKPATCPLCGSEYGGNMKIAMLADLHLKTENPICRLDNYFNTGLRKFKWVKDMMGDDSIILVAGDIFDTGKPQSY